MPASRRHLEYELEVLPFGIFVAKCVAVVAAIVAFTLTLASYRGMPIVLLILCGLLIGLGSVMRNAVIGRHVYALGGNRAAAKLSGVKDQRVTFLVCVNMGVLAAAVTPLLQQDECDHGEADELGEVVVVGAAAR